MTVKYATFHDPESANHAFIELLQRGAAAGDLIVITKRSYQDESIQTADGRLDVTEGTAEDPKAEHVPESIPDRTAEALFGRSAQSDSTSGSGRILRGLRFPGDLAERLQVLGFEDLDSQSLESSVLQGGSLLILLTPSGPVEESQFGEVIELCGGTPLAQDRGAYLG